MIRILFTGVGRRIELIKAFREASLVLNKSIKIYGADMAASAPALCFCDETRKICAMRDPAYIDELLKICADDEIDLVIPTIDTDLLVLSQSKYRFDEIGTKVMISSYEMVSICRDKNYTSDFFVKCGLHAPRTYNDAGSYSGAYPCFIKPKDGSSSINAFKVNDEEELSVYSTLIGDYIIQQFVKGTEYTVDVFCDFDGNPVYITPRIRLAVRAGEVLKTQIVSDPVIESEIKALIKEFKPCGPITVQLIKEDETGINYYIEINPRYGGGAPLSMKAGARSAEAILKLLSGEKLAYMENSCIDNAVLSRFDDSVYIIKPLSAMQASLSSVKGVIFDLDDTLYPERDYVKSGYLQVARFLGDPSLADKMWEYFHEGKPAIDMVLEDTGRPDMKEECVRTYRDHSPDIRLYPGVTELIRDLKASGIKVGIITDGRVKSQEEKIKALGLNGVTDDIIITDSLGGVQFRKPNDIAFRIMAARWRLNASDIVYIGDNLAKDHQAPSALGMSFIHFDNPDGIYAHTSSMFEFVSVHSFEELDSLLRDILT